MHKYFQVYMIKEVKPRSETFQGTSSYRSFDSHSIPRWQDRRPFVVGVCVCVCGGGGGVHVERGETASIVCSVGGVCLLLNVPATGECISRTDLPRQFYVLPH